MRLAGLEPLSIGDDSLFVNVGERTNVTGSRAFAKLILAGDYTGAVEVARQQVASGAQIIDVNMDEAMLDSKAAMVQVPEPHRRRARHRPRAGDDRLVEVGGHRGGPEVRAGQVDRQFDLDEGGRGRVPAPGGPRAALRRRGDRDGLRREGPGRHLRAQGRDLPAGLRPPDAQGRLPGRGHRLRPQHLRDRDRHRGAQQLRGRLHQRDALDPAAPAAREGVGRRVERQLLVSRQRAGARGDPHGVPLSRHTRRDDDGHRQRRPARRLRRDSAGAARAGRGRGAQPAAGCDRAARRARRIVQVAGQAGHRGPVVARGTGRGAAVARARARDHHVHHRGHRGGAAEIRAADPRDRRPADGRDERRRRPLRRRARCSCRRS